MFISFDSGQPKSLLARIVGAVLAVAVFAVAMMFSVVFFTLLACLALIFWGVWQWKTRALRRMMRERMESMERMEKMESGRRHEMPGGPMGKTPHETTIIEGEAVRVNEDQNHE